MVDMGMDMSDMGGMKMSGHGGMQAMEHGDQDPARMTMKKAMQPKPDKAPATDLSQRDHGGMHLSDTGAMMEPAGPVIARHGPDMHGPGNITVADMQRYRLHERGTGLKGLSHRVLTYSQLRSLRRVTDTRPVSKTIELHLTGNMDRYLWSFDGTEYSWSDPLEFPYDQRIRLVLVNDTMMEHPIHLHGMFMELENEQGEYLPLKHTISVLPGSRVSLLITTNEPGRWFFHCHFLYHMEMGMARVVHVGDSKEEYDV
jgi:FtsP/CotA-like multicopper oxidase with cupredoxin domain